MAIYRDTIVKQAKAWIGKNEADNTHEEIIDIYNAHKPLARGYKVKYTDEWCATFVSAVAIKCKATNIIPTECGCEKMIELFKEKKCWKENDAYTPKAGDIIFYDWDDSGKGDNKGHADHVGIVEKVSGTTITVIEGNKGGEVSRRALKVNGKYIRGYGLPKYDTEVITPIETIKVGDTVRLKQGALTYTGQELAAFVYTRNHKVKEIKGARVVITYRGVTIAAVKKSDLIKV
jgi:surface antigen